MTPGERAREIIEEWHNQEAGHLGWVFKLHASPMWVALARRFAAALTALRTRFMEPGDCPQCGHYDEPGVKKCCEWGAADVDALKAEVERLRADLVRSNTDRDDLQWTADFRQNEVERLRAGQSERETAFREALAAIIDDAENSWLTLPGRMEQVTAHARAALAGSLR